MNTVPITRRRLIAAACTMSLSDCSLVPDPPAPRMYLLSPADFDPTENTVPRSSLVIDTPVAPENLDSDRIALTRGATRFGYFADATWTDRVPALLRTLLVESFETNGEIADVWTEPDTITAGYLLQTQVRAFAACYDDAALNPPVVEVSLDMRLVRLPGNRTVGHALMTDQSVATRNKISSVVQAFDVATGIVLSRCVAWTLTVMRT